MAQVNSVSRLSNDATIAELFFADGGFGFFDDQQAYRKFSRKLSGLLARPVVVANLEDLPHAYKNPFDIPAGNPFTKEQTGERAQTLREICAASLPNVDAATWDKFDLAYHTANHADSVAGTIIANSRPNGNSLSTLTPRMQGDFWQQVAIVLVPDRRWSDKSMWSSRSGLDEEVIQNYPKGDGAKYISFFHELSHILQSCPSLKKAMPVLRWKNEKNADQGAITYSAILADDPRAPKELARSLREAIALEAPVRALARFLMAPAFYSTALAVDGFLHARGEPSYEKTCAVDNELRCRAYATRLRRSGLHAPLSATSDSKTVQNMVSAYRAGTLKNPGQKDPIGLACDTSTSPENRLTDLSALHEVLTSHAVTDPLTRRTGQLVMEAARIFCPQIFEEVKVDRRTKAELTVPAPRTQQEGQPQIPAASVWQPKVPELAPQV